MDIATSTNIFCERSDGTRIPMEQSLLACAKAGYRLLDFGFPELAIESARFHESGDGWKEEIHYYKKLAEQHGLSFVQSHATIMDFCHPAKDYDGQLRRFKRSIEGTAILGAPWAVCHPATKVENGATAPSTHEENVRFFKAMADYAATLGVGIAIENMWGSTGGVKRYAISPEEVARLVDDVGKSNVGVCWDVEHASVEKLPQGEAILKIGHRMKATHISDETGPNNIHILPYTGFVQWEEVISALAAIQYSGAFAFEIQHYLPAIPLELVPEAMTFSVAVGRHMVNLLNKKGLSYGKHT